jgi:hypothetical protein
VGDPSSCLLHASFCLPSAGHAQCTVVSADSVLFLRMGTVMHTSHVLCRCRIVWVVQRKIGLFCAAGMGISYLVQRWKDKPMKLFEAARQEAAEGRLHVESVAVLKKIYRSVVLSVPRMPCVSEPHVLNSCVC